MSYSPPPSDPGPPYDPTRPDEPPPSDASGATLPPRPPGQSPSYPPGYAPPVHPQPEESALAPAYPATAPFPAYGSAPQVYAADPYQADPYQQGQHHPGQQAYHPDGPGKDVAPRRSNVPLVAVIVAVALLLCSGVAAAGVLIVQNVTNRAKEAVRDLPSVPTELPALPTEIPTELPELPELPQLPDLPELPGLPTGGNTTGDDPATGKTVSVVYEVTGDGAVDISYTQKLGQPLKRVKQAKLPWRTTVSMTGPSYASVIALRTGTASGSITCTATVDGKQVASRTAEGALAIATCSKLILE